MIWEMFPALVALGSAQGGIIMPVSESDLIGMYVHVMHKCASGFAVPLRVMFGCLYSMDFTTSRNLLI
jgi:hypothetical protein